MGQDYKKWISHSFLFLGLFAFFSLPILLFSPKVKTQKLSLTYPVQKRQLASIKKQSLGVARKQCKATQIWRYSCDRDQKNCAKDRLENILKCQKL